MARRRRSNFNPHHLDPKADDIFVAEGGECSSCGTHFEDDQLVIGKPWGVVSWRYYCSRACAADNFRSPGQRFADRVLDRSKGLKGLGGEGAGALPWPPSGEVPPTWMTADVPAAAEAMFLAYWAATHNNGFDWRLGRYVPTHWPERDKGALLILKPMTRAWSGKNKTPIVMVEWLMALSHGAKLGEGTRTMKWVCALADEHGVQLRLHAGNQGQGGMKTLPGRVLVKFYERFGFVRAGPRSYEMTRDPR